MNAPDTQKIDRLLQFILATAGQEDFPNRELGEIHLIKYVYLADLAYARHHNGETYTSLPWKFHHFGPWSDKAFLRIEPALLPIGAEKKMISLENPKYDGEFVRWVLSDDNVHDRLEDQLPLIVTTSVQKYVHRYNAATEDLLHFVYKTWPMLNAKPGEMLDFSIPGHLENEHPEHDEVEETSEGKLSARQKKKKKQAIGDLKKAFKQRLKEKKKKPKIKFTPPPYDDIYFEGLKKLDSLAGEEIKPLKGVASFSEDLWKSKARFDPDVPR